ncbi:MAG: hypothetical protein V4615_07460 [Bacteroidota bacterium]
MKFIRSIILSLLCGSVFFCFNSCKKITEDQIVQGLWKVKGAYVGPSLDNYLNQLPSYTDGNECCTYKLSFERDGVVVAYYITYNNVQSITAGSWYLNSGNEIYIQVGTFIDGTFDIAKPSLKHWKLSSDFNHIAAYDSINPQLDTTYTQLDLLKI